MLYPQEDGKGEKEPVHFDPFPDLPADFGPEVPEEGIDGLLLVRGYTCAGLRQQCLAMLYCGCQLVARSKYAPTYPCIGQCTSVGARLCSGAHWCMHCHCGLLLLLLAAAALTSKLGFPDCF